MTKLLWILALMACGGGASQDPGRRSATLTIDPTSPGKQVKTVGGSNHTGFTVYAPQEGLSLVSDLRAIPYGMNRINFFGQTPPGNDDFTQLPLKSDGSWNFSILDKVVQVALELRKNGGPDFIFSIAYCPPFLSVNGTATMRPTSDEAFAKYCGRLVRYYNTASGFVDDLGASHKIDGWTADRRIRFWEVWNEPDDTLYVPGNPAAFTPAEFKQTFVAANDAMRAADGLIKIGGPNTAWQHKKYLDKLLESPAADLDFISIHQYAGEASDSDARLLSKAETVSSIQAPEGKLLIVGEINALADWNDPRPKGALELAYMPLAYKAHIEAGIPHVIRWETVEDAFPLFLPDGSRHRTYWMERHFWSAIRPNSTLVKWASSSADVVGLAALEGGKLRIVIVNQGTAAASDRNGSGIVYDIEVSGLPTGTYETIVVDRTTDPQGGPSPSLRDKTSVRLTIDGYGMAVVRQQ